MKKITFPVFHKETHVIFQVEIAGHTSKFAPILRDCIFLEKPRKPP